MSNLANTKKEYDKISYALNEVKQKGYGIVTPGTYYSYFDREINRKNSSVISKNIYNSSRRATSKE